MFAGARSAQAHPHVWITVETTVLYDNGAFVGLEHKWSFDEFYTAMAIEGLDKNKDGKYDRQELAELAKVNVEGLKEFSYFTHAGLAGQELKFGEVTDYWLEHADGVLSLHFRMAFAKPVLAEAKGLTFSVFDPTFFIAFTLAKAEPVRLAKGTPERCKVLVDAPAASAQGGLAGAFSSQLGGAGISLGKPVSVECGSS
jgi:ABC-type uncharacterized transport system substrate-binding protein